MGGGGEDNQVGGGGEQDILCPLPKSKNSEKYLTVTVDSVPVLRAVMVIII